MSNILDVYERTTTGPVMTEHDFDMKVFIPEIRKVVKKYGIAYDRKNPIPSDDVAADNLYEAALDFMTQAGVYCMDTSRHIQFTREEILRAVKDVPRTCLLGEGKEAKVFGLRKPDDRKIPYILVGSGIVFTREENATNVVEGYVSIPEVDCINIPTLSKIRGIPVMAGTPAEFYATIRGLRIGLEAIKRAGRPGLPIVNHHPTAAVAVTNIAASAPQFGCRPTDAWLCGTISEMKISYETLNKIAYLKAWGANVAAEAGPMLGGYCGGPEGFAVLCTAYVLMGQLIHKGDYHHNFPFHFKHTTSATRDTLWGISMAIQAASRNIPIPTMWAPYCAAGPMTKMYFYEAAAILLTFTTSGAPGVMQPHPAKAVKIDGITPMEAKFAAEIVHAAAKLDRAKANEIVIGLLEKYESDIENPPSGSRYQECFDPDTGKASEEYIRLYDEVKKELAQMGIPFD